MSQCPSQEVLKLALDALENNKPNHFYCEDTWYSCPKHGDGCANELEGDECNCGADEINAEFDKAITAIKEALADIGKPQIAINSKIVGYVAPQRTWVGLTEIEFSEIFNEWEDTKGTSYWNLYERIESTLREKNT